ncbi:MAG TPA: AMP-binding protein, partial [Acidimicrobiales bacterium]|nr:AMP-binding protein [Acidimicrobiales bacterium]
MTSAPRTVLDGFLATVRRQPDAIALRELDGRTWTWTQYADDVARVAGGLRAAGVRPGDRVVLMMRNRPEFHLADLAVVALRATPISVYNSSSSEQLEYLIGHCQATVVVTEDGDFADRVLAAAPGLPALRACFVVGEAPAGTRRWGELTAAEPIDLADAERALDPADLLTVIYTSGTTGPPKGVMLNHANVIASAAALSSYIDRSDDTGRRLVSYLPMAHVAERMVSHYGHVLRGSDVTVCPDMTELAAYLVAVRPHTLFGPPRVWEKLAAGVQASVAARGEETAARFAEALAVGRQVQALRATGEEPAGELAETWAFVDEVAFAPVRAAIGLDACEIAFSGAAPVPAEVIDFLRDIGIPMSEVYGMSENTGGMTWEPYLVKPGRVGTAYPGVEVVTAPDGEVLCRGPIVFSGYLDDP